MRTPLVSVVGSGKRISDEVRQLSEEVGAALVQAGFGVVAGGLGGVMEAVSRGAFQVRGTSGHPPIVGILPGYDADEGNRFIDVVLPTGLGHARNAVVAAAGDAMICIGGATGALSEVALARRAAGKTSRNIASLAAGSLKSQYASKSGSSAARAAVSLVGTVRHPL